METITFLSNSQNSKLRKNYQLSLREYIGKSQITLSCQNKKFQRFSVK